MPNKVDKPNPDSQYRLKNCRGCKSDDVVYIKSGGTYRVKCVNCGNRTPWFICKHDAQQDWNGRFGL